MIIYMTIYIYLHTFKHTLAPTFTFNTHLTVANIKIINVVLAMVDC